MKLTIDITDQMSEIVEFLRQETEIDLGVEHVTKMLQDEPELVVDISVMGWSDSEVQSRIAGMVTRWFLGRGWPTYGEKINFRSFIQELGQAAEKQGYKTLGNPNPDVEVAEISTVVLSPLARSIIEKQVSQPGAGAPFIATLVHADGTEEPLLLNHVSRG